MLKRADPNTVNSELKEAVCESLLANLFNTASGGGIEGKEILNIAPSVKFVSGFLEPLAIPLHSHVSVDAARNPIHIITQGIDLQASKGLGASLSIKPRFSVYVRLLPAESHLCEYPVKLELTPVASRARRANIREARKLFAEQHHELKEINPNKYYADLNALSKHVSDLFLAEKGLELEETEDDLTRKSQDENMSRAGLQVPEGEAINLDNQAPEEKLDENDSDTRDVEFYAKPGMPSVIPDNLVKGIKPTQRWLRIDIDDIPPLIFGIDLSEAERQAQIEEHNRLINHFVNQHLANWISSSDPRVGGKFWAYPANRVFRPSEIKNWSETLKTLRSDIHRKGSLEKFALPRLDIQWEIDLNINPDDLSVTSVHVALENKTDNGDINNVEIEESIFLTEVSVELDSSHHHPIMLDRIKPSYRYSKYLTYPALGFNSGVTAKEESSKISLTTTWMPVYRQPRIRPFERTGIDVSFRALQTESGVIQLRALPDQFNEWIGITEQTTNPGSGVSTHEQSIRETVGFKDDLKRWRLESDKIRQGVELLITSSTAFDHDPDQQEAFPYRAWVYMNETMERVAGIRFDSWRLFQVAFILSQLPGISSRLDCYTSEYDSEWDESVALLYFATGGGKTESFFGLLIFNLFLDRLRGKHNGVTALIRYPLRLLTIQQAQRLMKTLAKAEQVRWKYKLNGKPFAIGFWVGSGNTPNWRNDVLDSDVPVFNPSKPIAESSLLGNSDYEYAIENWRKLPACPFCKETTGLRKYLHRNGLVGHACFNVNCDWNMHHGGAAHEPLPFYIIDEDIYEQAPSVILGTIDKLALLGQSAGTIRRFIGMFGLSPNIDPGTGCLAHRVEPMALQDVVLEKLAPFYATGRSYFFDPFPSLIIQDEAHLLEESLGTFSGIFETAFEHILTQLSTQPRLMSLLAKEPGTHAPRMPKIVAASATVSEPEKQMEQLYQRTVTQFPVPGPDLYTSFYAKPEESSDAERKQNENIELSAHTARFYASILTNGRPHTSATVEILGQFHLLITRWLSGLNSADIASVKKVRDLIEDGLNHSELKALYLPLIQNASNEELATLIDLHRIALTYVTNKKGGDQIMAAENETTGRIHESAGVEFNGIHAELISGAVSAGEIEDVINKAELRPQPNEDMQDISDEELLRSVVATSAISHGVDVDEFNTMFFAGMPSDPSEYIQSSSRVGRTHVGCSILIPTPQRRRDRYILETHDQYHRFLERMIRPASINRWAENALKRALPSLIQAYLIAVVESLRLMDAPDDEKHLQHNLERMNDITRLIREMGETEFKNQLEEFINHSIGLDHPLFSPTAKNQFKDILLTEIRDTYLDGIKDLSSKVEGLRSFFDEIDRRNTRQKLAPMLSLRDVDPSGKIYYRRLLSSYPAKDQIRDLMTDIRKGKF